MGSVIGEITGTNAAASNAINAQRDAASQSNATQLQMYNQTREDNAAYRDAGKGALSQMQDPSLSAKFTAADFQQDPGYQFQMSEGQKALERSAAAKGGLQTGGTLKALANYSQGVANQGYQTALSNFKNDQNQRFGQLSTIAGMGQGAVNQTNAASQNYGNQVSQTQMGLGNAQAAATIGAANANSEMISQGIKSGTAAMMFSDERLKENVTPIPKDELREFRAHLRAFKFDYKHEVFGPSDFYGVMAQDMEKSKLGRTCVFEDEFGNKKIDPKRAMSLCLAAIAEG